MTQQVGETFKRKAVDNLNLKAILSEELNEGVVL